MESAEDAVCQDILNTDACDACGFLGIGASAKFRPITDRRCLSHFLNKIRGQGHRKARYRRPAVSQGASQRPQLACED